MLVNNQATYPVSTLCKRAGRLAEVMGINQLNKLSNEYHLNVTKHKHYSLLKVVAGEPRPFGNRFLHFNSR